MKTLIIHLNDPTTKTLCPIYENIKDKTVITDKVKHLNRLINKHDRIIMLGHGSPLGLFSYGSYLISRENVEFLRSKENSIFIWCHANEFTEKYQLHGFATGMFISELEEANWYGVKCSQNDIDVSTELFVNIVTKYINESTDILRLKVHDEYHIEGNNVVEFNRWEMFMKNQSI
jgi:hypothetical protein